MKSNRKERHESITDTDVLGLENTNAGQLNVVEIGPGESADAARQGARSVAAAKRPRVKVIDAVLIVLILGLAGLGGFVYWQHQHAADPWETLAAADRPTSAEQPTPQVSSIRVDPDTGHEPQRIVVEQWDDTGPLAQPGELRDEVGETAVVEDVPEAAPEKVAPAQADEPVIEHWPPSAVPQAARKRPTQVRRVVAERNKAPRRVRPNLQPSRSDPVRIEARQAAPSETKQPEPAPAAQRPAPPVESFEEPPPPAWAQPSRKETSAPPKPKSTPTRQREPSRPLPAPRPVRLDANTNVELTSVSGALTKMVVGRGVKHVEPSFRDCYKQAAARARRVAPGRVVVSFVINEFGRADRISTTAGPLPGVAACVQEAARSIRTRTPPDVGVAKVELTINYQPL